MQAQLNKLVKSILNKFLPMDAMNLKTLDTEPSINNARLSFFAEI